MRTPRNHRVEISRVFVLVSSLRSGFAAYFVLSPVNGFIATVIPEKLASQELDASTAASGPHDLRSSDSPNEGFNG
jgi:hypothetical protein